MESLQVAFEDYQVFISKEIRKTIFDTLNDSEGLVVVIQWNEDGIKARDSGDEVGVLFTLHISNIYQEY